MVGDLLTDRGQAFEIFAVGGGSLLLLGLIDRPTEDLDLVAVVRGRAVGSARPMPIELKQGLRSKHRVDLEQLAPTRDEPPLAGRVPSTRRRHSSTSSSSPWSCWESRTPGAATATTTRWDLRFRVLSAFRRLLAATATKSLTTRNIEARRFVTDHATTWQHLDLTPPAPASPDAYAADLAAWIDPNVIVQAIR